MNNNRILTVSIGTSAFNEEHNIKNMLESVIVQREKTIEIKEIIVISDGSTDKTVKMAKSIKDKRIQVIDDRKRLGQPARVNQLLKSFNSDVLVLIDSDMILKDNKAIEKITKKFHQDKDTALVCGNKEPLPARTFLESAINNYIYARNSLENEFSFVNTAYVAHAFLAYSKKFARALVIPKDILNADAYGYFTCSAKGYKRYYAEDAIVLYRSPSSIKDHVNQSIRHLAGGIQLYNYFGKEFVDDGFAVPAPIMLKIMLYQLRKNPLGYIFLKILHLYCSFKSKKDNKNLNTKWTTITSSKMPIL